MSSVRPPLVALAGPAGTSDPSAGVWLAEDIETIWNGVTNGSWVDATLGSVSAGLDGLALVSDPTGTLLQYGVAWIIEHVKPLTEALDWLAGDPARISAQAQTWRNVAGSLLAEADDLDHATRWDITEWSGDAADAYRVWSGRQRDSLSALAAVAEIMAAMTEGAGALVAGVRMMVRDAIATLVSRLITYAAEEAFTLGVGTPLLIEQVSTLCASWAARISEWLRGLIRSLTRLRGLAGRLNEAVEAIKALLGRLRGHENGLTTPSGKPDPGRKPRGRRTDAPTDKSIARGLQRENESADVLARHGYDVEQNPPSKPNGKEPDYLIEGSTSTTMRRRPRI